MTTKAILKKELQKQYLTIGKNYDDLSCRSMAWRQKRIVLMIERKKSQEEEMENEIDCDADQGYHRKM